MNTLFLALLAGCGVGLIVAYIFGKITKFLKTKYPALPTETVKTDKVLAGLSLTDPVLWIKDLMSLFNPRKLIIYAIILVGIFSYAYMIGNQNVPVKVDLGYGREAVMNLGDGTYMHITKDGEVRIIDNANPAKAKVIRVLKVKDLGALQSKLSAFGFQFRPIAVVGYGLGMKGDGGIEAGVGVSFFRYWQGSIEAFLTQKAIYVGTSYRLDRLKLDNTSIGIAVGKEYDDFFDTKKGYRIMVYCSIKF